MSNPYRRMPDPKIRPPSCASEIPVVKASKPDASKGPSRYRGSTSSGVSRDVPKSLVEPSHALAHDEQESNTEVAQSSVCEACEENKSPVWNCSYCDTNFCDDCWVKQGPHKAGKTGPDGLPHEKANPAIVKRLQEILTPPQEHSQQQMLHTEDEDTTWFGMVRNSQNSPAFQNYGRYSAIMADSNSGEFKSRYPMLVSFIGQTGAGKSTLIKMLIDQQERTSTSQNWTLPSPVAGTSANGNTPTSGDVHLYSDPKTYNTEYPMLYADCEGLEGGENTPMAAQYRNSAATSQKEKGRDNHTSGEHRKRRKVSKSFHSTQREIKWANSPEKSKRQYAVTELYPRLLYTFSDVIVFVLRNAKTFESTVLGLLIQWASSSFEKSVNQPTLPHAVIALNAADTKVGQQEWDPEYATQLLMSNVAESIERDPTYRGLRDYWVGRGRRIRTMQDLLECFYSSITVVRIPGEGRYMMIDDQVKKLHEVITRRCSESFDAKKRSRMLSNSENLNVYLQCAFDHFSQDLHIPFNFMDVSFKINPIPLDFGGNILKLAVAMKSQFIDPGKLFKDLSHMVASFILLDCVRQDLKGSAEQILEMQYMDPCDTALDDFCAIFWPCSFVSRRGERCVNVKERHAKGHQNLRGSVIASGLYESSFTFDNFCEYWYRWLKHNLTKFQDEFDTQMARPKSADPVEVTTKIHHANVTSFYYHMRGAHNFYSHTTCFCCLRELAEHPLPCGHVLCTACIKGYGKPHEELSGSFTIAACPLHDFEAVFSRPAEIYFKPPLAGLRILSLDGGGVRGIVILEVLRQIQQELGGRIQVQEFFDLIVGTSTGGILALGLGVKNWSVGRCTELFLKMVDKAFTPKIFGGVGLGTNKYRTRSIEDAFSECFKEQTMFGGVHDTPLAIGRKVAVTSATETAEQAVIFTNYNRADDEQIGYQLVRADDPKNEVLIREAARATSAAPTYFKPFRNPRTNEGFVDGAVFHNNPVRIANYESKLLWPDADQRPPDILLSLGTGQHGADTDNFLDASRFDIRRFQIRKMLNQVKPTPRKARSMPMLTVFPEVESWLTIFKKRVESALDAEATWREFRKDVVGMSTPAAAERYIRINPRTRNRIPKMDDKSQLDPLLEDIKNSLRQHGPQTKIKNVAQRLVASSFYFEKSGPSRHAEEHIIVQGKIRCRFAAGSHNLRDLGEYIRRHQQPNFQPFFLIQEALCDETSQCIEFTTETIHKMTDRGLFHLDSVVIPVTSEEAVVSIDLQLTNNRGLRRDQTGHPISGFPRILADGELLKKAISPPTTPKPERPKIFNKRQSLREKRNARIPLERPASDSNISYATQNERESSQDQKLVLRQWGPSPAYDDEEALYELDAGPPLVSGATGDATPRTGLGDEWREDYGEQDVAQGDGDEMLRALALSQEAESLAPRRTNTGGFDEDEIAEAMNRSLHVK
ncbi:hypothetical protein OPT61_g3904 [Boeremia exigua]|uniref:Uncharacterized protein n=1 Tax=Boeremia exigua TaxID=749465 RepID=A0ACC2IGD0_9PLEO|nr:hypothetical protein OPT61_g3904 [Boeremia exigua]